MNFAAKAAKLFGIMTDAGNRTALLRHGVAATVEHRVPLARLGTMSTVIDVGANRGQFALLARRLWPEAAIISFEPLPAAAQRFKSVFAADPKTRLVETALGDTDGQAECHISRADDSSSMLEITQRQSEIFPGTEEVGRVTVPIARFDAVLQHDMLVAPALLKIDVQGFELAMLQGAADSLACFDHIYCESAFQELYRGQSLAQDVIAFLGSHGFVLRGVHHICYDRQGSAVQADFLFSRAGEPQ